MDDFKPQQPQKQDDLSSEKPNDFQAAYDEKPETYVTPSGEPTTIEATQQPSLTMPKKKGGAGKWVLGGLVVLLISGLGAVAYWQWAEAQNAKQELGNTQGQLQSAQADLAKASEKKNDETTLVAEKTKTDKELITESVVAYWHAAKGAEKDKLTTTVDKLELPFARTSVGIVGGAGGVSCISKKSDDLWLVLFCAQGTSPETEALMTKYGVPESIIKT